VRDVGASAIHTAPAETISVPENGANFEHEVFITLTGNAAEDGDLIAATGSPRARPTTHICQQGCWRSRVCSPGTAGILPAGMLALPGHRCSSYIHHPLSKFRSSRKFKTQTANHTQKTRYLQK
jgi:hypothetical protein